VKIPPPRVGLVISYAYLWWDEARAGLEEGRKDRPCVVVIALEAIEGRQIVTVAPITHSPPSSDQAAGMIELPPATKQRLGLDGARSWVVASDLNQFVWPGVDLRPTRRGGDQVAYGFLPDALTQALRIRILELARRGVAQTTKRSQ
jgi:hypothetical protein